MHYVGNYSTGKERVVGKFAMQVWQVSIGPFFTATTKPSFELVAGISQCVLVISLVLAVVYMLYKKQWKLLAPLSIGVAYFFVHAMRTNTRTRYAMPMGWLVLLLCLYGLVGGWQLLSQNKRFSVPKPVVIILQIIVLIGSVVWLFMLVPYLPKLGQMSSKSVSVAYVGIGVVVAVTIGGIYAYKARLLPGGVTVAVLLCLMVVSNQFSLARVVGNGDRDWEFKLLADWYAANAEPKEKLITTLPGVVNLYAPSYRKYILHSTSVTAETPADFIRNCYRKNITYVAWDSRIGLTPDYTYYRRWKIGSTRMLGVTRDVDPVFEYITQVKHNDRSFINIFRLRALTDEQKQKLLQGTN